MSETGTPMRIAAGRWMRHTFVWDNLISALKTFTWLGPLTLLIWVYAERAQVVPMDNIPIPIAVRSADPNRFVRLKNNPNVVAKLSGPRSRIEALRQSIRPTSGGPAVVINLDPKLPLGDNMLDAVAQIGQAEQFRYSGVNIIEVQPQLLQVDIDTYEERELDVQVPASVRNLRSTPEFTPPRVRVRAPARSFVDSGSVTLEADLAASKVLDRPGRQPTTVPVYSPQLQRFEGVVYLPATVTTTLEVGSSTRNYELASVPVSILWPGGDFQDRYRVLADPWTVYGVRVTGPPDQVARIEQGEIRPSAVVPINGSDAPTDGNPRPIERTVEIRNLPDGVTVSDPPGPFKLSIVPRAAQ